MASFCVAVIRGINIPLLLVSEVTSKAAEAAGVFVPMPTWAKVFVAINTNTAIKRCFKLIRIVFLKRLE